MKAKVVAHETGFTTNKTYHLELSFIEMHVLSKAMSNYSNRGYGQHDSSAPNYHHAEAAEKFHDEFSDLYNDDKNTMDEVPVVINDLMEFEAYCTGKGYKVRAAAQIPEDGYYAELKFGEAKTEDFTQINLESTVWYKRIDPETCNPPKTVWARLSFKDCSNQEILKSHKS